MNTVLFLLGSAIAVVCAAIPDGSGGLGGHSFINQPRSDENNNQLNYTKQPRISKFKLPGNNVQLNYTKQPRIPKFELATFDRSNRNYVKCSKKTQKVTLGPGEYAYFESPNYPNNYPKKKTCKWQFKSAEPITIECFDFNLEKAKKGKCKADILTIDSTAYCGSEDHIYYEGEKSIKVQFKSNKKKNYGGFYCFVNDFGSPTYGPGSSPPTEGPTEGPTEAPPSSSCKCGQANQGSRIVGGKETEENEYPWQAAMIYKGTTQVFCGGSVIGSKHILTAAHCTQAVTDYNINYQVLVGAHSLTNPAPSQMKINPAKIIQHTDYDDSTIENDIAIIVLSKSISFTSSEIRPVCLPTSAVDDYDNVDAIVSGWGTLTEGGSQPDVLMDVDVPTMSNTKCEKYYGGGITNTMLCAGYKKGKKDSCQGDSGGPLIYDSGSGYTQIGVVSWGAGCAKANYPGVYARVTKYLSWISDNSASSTKCPAA